MNYSIHRLTLDVGGQGIQTALSLRKGESGHRLEISLTDGGNVYRISPDCTAMFAARKADGAQILNDCRITDNRIIYDVTAQTTAVVGKAECEIRLSGSGDMLLIAPKFALFVEDTAIDEGEIESSCEYSALDTLIGRVEDAISSAVITEAEAHISAGTVPAVTVTQENTSDGKKLSFTFSGIKGDKGDKGNKGDKGDAGPSGIFIGSGSVPEGYHVKIDPDGDTDEIVEEAPNDGKQYARMNRAWAEIIVSGGGGTNDHNRLANRDADAQHPISAIVGLADALDGKQAAISDLSAIRTGAALGATALQNVPSAYRTAAAQDVIDGGKLDKSAQAEKTAAMTQAVGIDSDGKLWSIPGDDKLFECTYGVTPYSDVSAAINAGKIPYVKFSNHFFLYGKKQDGVVQFTVNIGEYSYTMVVRADGWSYTENVFATTDDLTSYRTASAQDVIDGGKLDKSGGTITGNLTLNSNLKFSGSAYITSGGKTVLQSSGSSGAILGDGERETSLIGSGNRPKYNNADMALLSDVPDISGQQRQITALKNLLDGVAYSTEEDTAAAYSKVVPTGAQAVSVNSFGGHSEVADGEIISTEVTEIESRKQDSTVLGTLTIPPALLTFLADKGYGWSVGSVYNEVDFERKKYIKRVGTVDLGTLTWSIDARYENRQFHSEYQQIKSNSIVICENYPFGTNTSGWHYNVNKTVNVATKYVIIVDNDFSTADAFKSAMNGVMLYYELAEPVEYDISDYLPDGDGYNLLLTEPGGTLTFKQAEDAQLNVPQDLTWAVKNSEVSA